MPQRSLLIPVFVLLAGCLANLDEHSLPPAEPADDVEIAHDAGVDDLRSDASEPTDSCAPESDDEFCERQRANCGDLTAPDNCGVDRTVTCGSCIAPDECGAGEFDNVCGCTPLTDEQFCSIQVAECGRVTGTDGCGAPKTVDCGTCDADETCAANMCQCEPEPDSELCGAQNADCGLLTTTDRCGGERMAECGSCVEPETCGGGENANQCGCTPETNDGFCDRLAATCGDVTAEDNCGVMRTANCGPENCGDDTDDVECGGGGTPNVCACTSQTDQQFCTANAASCGTISETDGCGNMRTVNCGNCSGYETCGGGGVMNQCGCAPETDEQFCTRLQFDCGMVTDTDNCGVERTADCGMCASNETCGASAPNACDCVPEDRATFCGDFCGELTATDNCAEMRTENCGSCGAGSTCSTSNQCTCAPENNSQFCSRLNGCGELTAMDNCENERTVDCLECDSGTCIDNTCSDCTPETDAEFCARNGSVCGLVTAVDNCGQTRSDVNCGSCDVQNEECQQGQCVCVGEEDNELCAQEGAECGSISGITDQCGDSRTASCGMCQGPHDQCIDNVCECQPETDTTLCDDAGAECGTVTVTDRCGETRSVNCGNNCILGACSQNKCSL